MPFEPIMYFLIEDHVSLHAKPSMGFELFLHISHLDLTSYQKLFLSYFHLFFYWTILFSLMKRRFFRQFSESLHWVRRLSKLFVGQYHRFHHLNLIHKLKQLANLYFCPFHEQRRLNANCHYLPDKTSFYVLPLTVYEQNLQLLLASDYQQIPSY